MSSCQCPVDLAVQLAQVCSAMLIVLFEQNIFYHVCVCMCMYEGLTRSLCDYCYY